MATYTNGYVDGYAEGVNDVTLGLSVLVGLGLVIGGAAYLGSKLANSGGEIDTDGASFELPNVEFNLD